MQPSRQAQQLSLRLIEGGHTLVAPTNYPEDKWQISANLLTTCR